MSARNMSVGIGCLLMASVCGTAIRSRAHEGEQIDAGGGSEGVAQSQTLCLNGSAAGYPCRNVDLLAYMPLSTIGGGTGSDIWGWTDPVTGKEYALLGRSTGTAFVDISSPENPIYVGNLPTQTVSSSWREIKSYGTYAVVVSEASGHGMQLFDLTQLRDVSSPPVTFNTTAHYAGFSNCHNIVVNEASGFAYAVGTNTCSGGPHMVDIHDPLNPTFAGCYSADGYTHDAQCVIYAGPDARYQDHEICFNSNEDTLTIVDVSDKNAPVMLSRTGYAGSGYVHQGWLTEDQAFFLLDDELDERLYAHNSRTYFWNLANLQAPALIGSYTGTSPAIDHNLFIRGSYAFQANYRSGLRILHLDDVATVAAHEAGFFDIYPPDDNPNFNGAWGNYPFFASGVVIVSGIEQGLFVLRPNLDSAIPTATFTATPTRTPTATPVPFAPCAATPRTDCRVPGKSSFVLTDDGLSSRRLAWKWLNGAATTAAEFGDPVAGSSSYTLCVYDETASTPALVMGAAAPAGGTCHSGKPCWKPLGRLVATGFKYQDNVLTPNGLLSVVLKQGTAGKARITITGRGTALPIPSQLATGQHLRQDAGVTVQLSKTDGGACWQAVYTAPAVRNDSHQFKDALP